jgi:hypothetical protein
MFNLKEILKAIDFIVKPKKGQKSKYIMELDSIKSI